MRRPLETQARWPDRLRGAGWILVAAMVWGGCQFAWQASGSLGAVDWLPRRLTQWVDANGVVRNLPAFFGLSLVVLALLRAGRPRRLGGGLLAVLAVGIEYPQLAMADRYFDWRDMVWGLAGVGAAGLAVAGVGRVFSSVQRRRRKRRGDFIPTLSAQPS